MITDLHDDQCAPMSDNMAIAWDSIARGRKSVSKLTRMPQYRYNISGAVDLSVVEGHGHLTLDHRNFDSAGADRCAPYNNGHQGLADMKKLVVSSFVWSVG